MELRTFFSSGYTTQQGTEISNTGVREAIQQLVSHEDTAKPLSDSAIEKQLKAKGIKVARRTIAKYRDQLGILPSHLRKKHSWVTTLMQGKRLLISWGIKLRHNLYLRMG